MVTPVLDDDVSDEDFTAMNPHHHQVDHHHQLIREFAPEKMKDQDRVSECLHIHPRTPVNSHNLLYLLPEFSRLWQLRAQMKIQQPWIHKMA